ACRAGGSALRRNRTRGDRWRAYAGHCRRDRCDLTEVRGYPMELDPKALALFTEGYQKILEGIQLLGYDTNDKNFIDTAARAAKGLHELIHDQEQVEFQVSAMLGKTFPAKYTEMVISKHNTAFGVCPHHLLPVIYRISMAYIPVDKVLGLSKLSRL